MQIAENTVVAFHYTLTNEAGQTIDSSRQREEPLNYLHGHGNIIPGLEKALVGKQAGDKLEVTVTPEEGYGERHEGLIQQVPTSAFEGAGGELKRARFSGLGVERELRVESAVREVGLVPMRVVDLGAVHLPP